MGLVEVKEVSKEYRVGEVVVSALQGISLEIEEKAFVSVIGPSGSGKTTLLNLIGSLDKPTQGLIRVAGTDITTLNRKSDISGWRSVLSPGPNGIIKIDEDFLPLSWV